MKEKLYPFNATKHAHDIEFRKNRLQNEMYEMETGITAFDKATYVKMNNLLDMIRDLLFDMLGGGIVWLTGKYYGLAIECVGWADMERANKNKKYR